VGVGLPQVILGADEGPARLLVVGRLLVEEATLLTVLESGAAVGDLSGLLPVVDALGGAAHCAQGSLHPRQLVGPAFTPWSLLSSSWR